MKRSSRVLSPLLCAVFLFSMLCGAQAQEAPRFEHWPEEVDFRDLTCDLSAADELLDQCIQAEQLAASPESAQAVVDCWLALEAAYDDWDTQCAICGVRYYQDSKAHEADYLASRSPLCRSTAPVSWPFRPCWPPTTAVSWPRPWARTWPTPIAARRSPPTFKSPSARRTTSWSPITGRPCTATTPIPIRGSRGLSPAWRMRPTGWTPPPTWPSTAGWPRPRIRPQGPPCWR